jgi:hypothetical protein
LTDIDRQETSFAVAFTEKQDRNIAGDIASNTDEFHGGKIG